MSLGDLSVSDRVTAKICCLIASGQECVFAKDAIFRLKNPKSHHFPIDKNHQFKRLLPIIDGSGGR